MPAEARMAIGDREMSLARHDRQRRRERGASAPAALTIDVGAEHVVAAVHGVVDDPVHRAALSHGGAALARLIEQPRAWRRLDRRRRRPARAARPRAPTADSARRREVARVEHLARDPATRVQRAASRCTASSCARPPRPRACRTRRTPPRRQRRRELAPQRQRERVSASCAGESSITTRWPMPAAVVPLAAKRASSTSTRSPSPASARAHAAPTIPAPTTIASHCAIGRDSSHEPPKPQRNGSRGSKRSVASPVTNAVPRTCGTSAPSSPLREPAGEQAAGDALLPPVLADRQSAARVQRRHHRRRPGAARRAIVLAAGAEHEVARVGVGARRRSGELDVIDLGAVGARDAGVAQRVLNRLREPRQLAHVRELDRHRLGVRDEEPVAAVRDVADDGTVARHVDRDVARVQRAGTFSIVTVPSVRARRPPCPPACRSDDAPRRAGRGTRACARRRSGRGRTCRGTCRC